MREIEKLTDSQIHEALQTLHGWSVKEGKLHRAFEFHNFVEAWGFMTQVAMIAERLDHHPEWYNVYGTVRIDLSTHDAGGITALDTFLAERINGITSISR